MSTLAVFVALGGTGAYAANEWNSSNIQDETLTGADVKGRVGTYSDPAVNGSLTTYDIAGHAANAGNGTRFIDGSLTGQDIQDNSLVGADVNESTFNLAEPWHEVGAPGEPAFNDGLGPGIFCYWTNVDSTFNSAAFLRDRSGIVRLKGFVRANDGGAVCGNPGNAELDKRIFSLPPGYRPARIEIHTALSNSALGNPRQSFRLFQPCRRQDRHTDDLRQCEAVGVARRDQLPLRTIRPERLPLARHVEHPIGRAPRPLAAGVCGGGYSAGDVAGERGDMAREP